jgi:type I restriction enzyme R subunit
MRPTKPSDDSRSWARQVFARFKALADGAAAFAFAERHDNIEAIYKKLEERRDTSDVTDLLKELHKIVNEAIRAQGVGPTRRRRHHR